MSLIRLIRRLIGVIRRPVEGDILGPVKHFNRDGYSFKFAFDSADERIVCRSQPDAPGREKSVQAGVLEVAGLLAEHEGVDWDKYGLAVVELDYDVPIRVLIWPAKYFSGNFHFSGDMHPECPAAVDRDDPKFSRYLSALV